MRRDHSREASSLLSTDMNTVRVQREMVQPKGLMCILDTGLSAHSRAETGSHPFMGTAIEEGEVSEWLEGHSVIVKPPPPSLRLSTPLSQAVVRRDKQMALKALGESAF